MAAGSAYPLLRAAFSSFQNRNEENAAAQNEHKVNRYFDVYRIFNVSGREIADAITHWEFCIGMSRTALGIDAHKAV